MLSHFSHVQFFETLWTVACQASLSMGFFRQEYWNGLPCPPQGDLPNLGIKPASPVTPAMQTDSQLLNHRGSPFLNQHYIISVKFPSLFEPGDWQAHSLGSHLFWSPQHFSSSVDGRVWAPSQWNPLWFSFLQEPDRKQEKRMGRRPSCWAPAGRSRGFSLFPCILTLDPLVQSSLPGAGPSESCDFLSWQAAGRGESCKPTFALGALEGG